MKFYVKAGKFIEGLKPAHCLAVRKIEKKWYWNEKISIDSSKDGITALAYQKDTFVVTNISEETHYGLGFLSIEKGFVTVNSFELMDALSSFASSDSIVIEDLGSEIKLMNASDEEEFQTVSVFDSHIGDPEIASKFVDKFVIDKILFIKGISKVAFAMGKNETQPYYKCLGLQTSDNTIRFFAGSGARFAIYDIEGIKLTKKPVTVYFPSYIISALKSILSKVKSDSIVVKQTKIETGAINQVSIEAGGTQVVISNLDDKINSPPLNMIIEHKYPYEISVDTLDLKTAVSGVLATYTKKMKYENDYHYSTITVDLKRGFLTLKADAETLSSRKAYLTGSNILSDKTKTQNLQPYFKCNSNYLTEIVNKAKKCKDIYLSFEDTSQVEIGKKTKPVLVSFPSFVNKTEETTEKLHLFFIVYPREEV